MELYIIAGPNGAGKTTFAHEFLPKYTDCTNFVNADLIARAIAPFSPDAAAFRAGRMMLDEMHSFAKRRVPFAFETTLSGRGYLSFIRSCKAQGYEIHLFFLSLSSVDLAVSRIRERVLRGGHDVPEQIVRRRFDRSTRNFLAHYRQLADAWTLFDNSGKSPETIAFAKGGDPRIINQRVYSALVRRYGRI
jgi:predicted ABC-type ATPase